MNKSMYWKRYEKGYNKIISIILLLAVLSGVFLFGCTSNKEANETSTNSSTGMSIETTTQEPSTEKTVVQPELNEYGLPDEIEGGSILQTFCWSFSTIEENLENIANAGFAAVQTSPIMECKVGENGGMQIQDTDDSAGKGKWYYHYQPTNYVIGNYQLGTEEEFHSLCNEAKKYGVKIIVDAVINHVSSDLEAVSKDVKELTDEPFHDEGEIIDYSDRTEVTQGKMLGLWDWNTQDKAVQTYLHNYLKKCIELGASGFRYDGAKHIELPDDEVKSDFWPTVLDNGASFQYGEILQGGSDRIAKYSEYMNVTASIYGETLRGRLSNNDLDVNYLEDFRVNSVDESKLVTWVESHDNYCNDASYSYLDNQKIRYGWAVIAARAGGTTLFFSRPDGSDSDNPWGNNLIGAKGDDNFMSEQVTQLNKFRNNMLGLDETLSNPQENTKVLMIQRGNKGAVIINISDEDVVFDNEDCVVFDGEYTNKLSDEVFIVKDEKISGTVKAGEIIIIY